MIEVSEHRGGHQLDDGKFDVPSEFGKGISGARQEAPPGTSQNGFVCQTEAVTSLYTSVTSSVISIFPHLPD